MPKEITFSTEGITLNLAYTTAQEKLARLLQMKKFLCDIIKETQIEEKRENGPRWKVGEKFRFRYATNESRIGTILDSKFCSSPAEWEYCISYRGQDKRTAIQWIPESMTWTLLKKQNLPTKHLQQNSNRS